MKIFFAHSMSDYDTPYEEQLLTYINKNFYECEIINPRDINNDINIEDRKKGLRYNEEKHFFPIIDSSDIVIAAPRCNNEKGWQFTIGVVIEIEYALSKNKKVIGIIDGQVVDINCSDVDKYYNNIVWQIPGEDPVTMRDRKDMIWK